MGGTDPGTQYPPGTCAPAGAGLHNGGGGGRGDSGRQAGPAVGMAGPAVGMAGSATGISAVGAPNTGTSPVGTSLYGAAPVVGWVSGVTEVGSCSGARSPSSPGCPC